MTQSLACCKVTGKVKICLKSIGSLPDDFRKRTLNDWLKRPKIALAQYAVHEFSQTRMEVTDIAAEMGIGLTGRTSREEYWENLFNYKFVISPEGL